MGFAPHMEAWIIARATSCKVQKLPGNRIVARQFCRDRRQTEKVGMEDLLEFGMGAAKRTPVDHEDSLDIRVPQTFEKNAFSHHTGRTGDNDSHFDNRLSSGINLRAISALPSSDGCKPSNVISVAPIG